LSHSYTNLQIRTGNPDKVREAIDLCDIGSAKMLSRAEINWVGVYPFMTEDDFGYLKQCAEAVSRRMALPVFGCMVPNSGAFRYMLFEHGELSDEYSYDPRDNPPFVGGKPEALLSLVVEGVKKKRLELLLHPAELPQSDADLAVAGDRMAREFAEVLGIPRAQMCTGFNYLKWAQAGR
jgi:hypothetical protein